MRNARLTDTNSMDYGLDYLAGIFPGMDAGISPGFDAGMVLMAGSDIWVCVPGVIALP
jgi:hypothetical protein